MNTIWITPDLKTPGKYSYNATITDGKLRVWLHLEEYQSRFYWMSSSAGKCGNARGRLDKRQKEQAKALRDELEPQFLAAIRAAGWFESIDPISRRTRWTRA